MSLLVFQLALALVLLSSTVHLANSQQNKCVDTPTWFRNLRIKKIDADQLTAIELDRIDKVRNKMLTYDTYNPGFMKKAVEFVKFMDPTSITKFCPYLNYFAYSFDMARDTQLCNDQRLSFKEAAENALNSMTKENVKTSFNQALRTVEDNHMAYDDDEKFPHSIIDTDLNQDEIIWLVRKQANNRSIRFGSKESAVYHMKKHPMSSNEANYVVLANQLIEDPDAEVKYTQKYANSITITFTTLPVKNYYKVCVIIITKGKIMLKTFFLKRHSR